VLYSWIHRDDDVICRSQPGSLARQRGLSRNHSCIRARSYYWGRCSRPRL